MKLRKNGIGEGWILKKCVFGVCLICILSFPNAVRAIDFHEDGEIHEGDIYDYVSVFSSATVNMTGGTVTKEFIAYDSSIINISAGDVNWLRAEYSSVLTMNGGFVNGMFIDTSGGAYLYDGIINDFLWANDTVNIYGYNFIYDSDAGEHSGGRLTGFWGNGTPFSIDLVKTTFGGTTPIDTWSQISLHEIPEPVTLLFFVFGAAFFPKKK